MGVADDLRKANEDSRRLGARDEPELTRAYDAQLRSALNQAAANYKKAAGNGLQASADWTPPSLEEVLDIQIRTARIRRAQRLMMARIAGVHSRIRGVDFDLAHPMTQDLLDKLGVRAAGIAAELRTPVAAAIARGWAEGLSVRDTARLIQQHVRPQLGAKATMLARTDLIGMSNGAGNGAAGMLNAAAKEAGEKPPIQSKRWLSSHDARVRDTHAAADGQTVPYDQQYTVGGEQLQYPGDPAGSNAETINCRCTELYEETAAPATGAPTTDDMADDTAPAPGGIQIERFDTSQMFREQRSDLSARLWEDVQDFPRENARLNEAQQIANQAISKDIRISTLRRGEKLEALASTREGDGALLIRNIASRGGGTGRQLIDDIVGDAHGRGLDVELDSTLGARPYYDAHGFTLKEGTANRYVLKVGDSLRSPEEAAKILKEGPPSVKMSAALTAPEGLRWSAFPKVQADVKEAIATLDRALKGVPSVAMDNLKRVHGTGQLPFDIDVTTDALGNYRFAGTRPVKIDVSPTGDHVAITALHEVGHYIDHQMLRDRGGVGRGFATESYEKTETMVEFINAAYRTKTIDRFHQTVKDGTVQYHDGSRSVPGPTNQAQLKKYAEYILEPAEIWARAFSQWAATRHGSAAVKHQMHDEIQKPRAPVAPVLQRSRYYQPTQWTDEEFDRHIAPAVEAVLREAGLLEEGSLSASGGLGRLARLRQNRNAVLPRGLAAVEGGEPPLPALLRQPVILGEDGSDLVVGGAVGAGSFDVQHGGQDTGAAGTPPTAVVPFQGEPTREDDMSVAETEPITETEAALLGRAWYSDLAFEGKSTGDGRFIVKDALSWRELPLTLMAMVETTEGGHLGAQVSGRIDTIEKDPAFDMDGGKLEKGVVAARGTGYFGTGEYEAEIERMVEQKLLKGVSVDMAIHEWKFRDPETEELIDPDEASDEQWERAFMGELEMAITDGEIMAATVCPTPAFADAKIALLASAATFNRTWKANELAARRFGIPEGQLCTTIYSEIKTGDSLTASATLSFPVTPSREAFFQPEPDGPQPLRFDKESGWFCGHLASWTQCHTGYINGAWSQCITPPRSRTDYAHFHVGEMPTVEGDLVPIGKLMLGEAHAPTTGSRASVRSFYDRTGTIGCYARAMDGKHGIWLSGCIKDDLTERQWRDLNANPPSGDWREYERNLELIAAIAVPVPGYPIPRSMLSLAASADGEMYVSALILTGGVEAQGYGGEAEMLAALIEDGADGLHALIDAD